MENSSFKFRQQPQPSPNNGEITLLAEDFQDIMDIVSKSGFCTCGARTNPPKPASGITIITKNYDQRTVIAPIHNHPSAPAPPLASKECFAKSLRSNIFDSLPSNLKASPLSFLSSRLSQFTKATRIFTTNDCKSAKVAAEFHQACDNIPNTLVIIKSGQYIAGGYTEVAWSSPSEECHKPSKLTFLFSVNRQKTYSVTDEKYAVFHNVNYGPSFGRGGNGLTVFNDFTDEEGGSSYLESFDQKDVDDSNTELIGGKWSKVDEYEVYKLE